MLSERIIQALTDQINREMYSAMLYLGMSSAAQGEGFAGCSQFFFRQHKEEMSHAYKFIAYLHDKDVVVRFLPIEATPVTYDTVFRMFEQGLTHEKYITACIHKIYGWAQDEKDYATQTFLQWFIAEQTEEEASFKAIVDKFRIVKESPHGLLMIDNDLSAAERSQGAALAQETHLATV